MTARTDAEEVIAEIEAKGGPQVAVERMALIGAKAVLRRLAALANYRVAHRDRLLDYARKATAAHRDSERGVALHAVRVRPGQIARLDVKIAGLTPADTARARQSLKRLISRRDAYRQELEDAHAFLASAGNSARVDGAEGGA